MRSLIILFVCLLLFGTASVARAQVPFPSAFNFSGYILFSFPCTCSPGQMVYVGGPTPGAYVYYPGVTPTFLYGQLYKPGTAVLGTYTPGGACLMVSTPCNPLPVTGTMTMVGTSL
jgi:hypothetical protein